MTSTSTLMFEPLTSRCECATHRDRAAADPERRISAHRTSQGPVVYYRCYCGSPGVAIATWAT